jgi:restriction system protein
VETKERTIWGIHAGRASEAENLFLRHNVIALGWVDMGDLTKLAATREAFKAKQMDVEPGRKSGYYPIASGQVYRFVHEMKKGDLVAYPSKIDRKIHLGEIQGDYQYDNSIEPKFPHRRAVKWLSDQPRTRFSQGALYEIGSAMSFFQIKNYADEFLNILGGKKIEQPVVEDTTIGYVAKDIQQNTEDFILKKLAQELKGHMFAEFVAHLLETMGYRTRVSPEGPDGGVDIIAHKDELGFEPPIIKVQVKSTEGSLGEPIVSQLYGKVDKNEFGLVVTLGAFTNQATTFARNKSNLRLIDGDDLVDLVLQHYDKFDSRYKGILPLQRVFVPVPLEEGEE